MEAVIVTALAVVALIVVLARRFGRSQRESTSTGVMDSGTWWLWGSVAQPSERDYSSEEHEGSGDGGGSDGGSGGDGGGGGGD